MAHPDDWLKAYLQELPTMAERRVAADALAGDVEAWREEQEARLRTAAVARQVVTGREAIELYLEEVRTDRPPAIYTGWHDLDTHLGRPITAGELVLIAARPGVGKTWALQAWIEKTLLSDPNAAAALLEMEMLPWHMGERLAAHALGVSPYHATLRAKGDLTVEEVVHGMPGLDRLTIHPRSLTVGQLPEALDAATERMGMRPTILAVDYLGLLGWDGSAGATTYQRASDNARRLKDIAREENVVVLAASQLSRAAGTGGSKPSLDSIRDSGVIEEASDRILGMWRDTEMVDEDAPPKPGDPAADIMVTVLKNRHGRSSGRDFTLRFDDAMRLVEPGMEQQEEFPF